MLHGIDGSLTGANAGREVFAYVPGSMYGATRGLQNLGDPVFTHYNMVDATPKVADLELRQDAGRLRHRLALAAGRRAGQGRQVATTRSTSPTRPP